ncbi:hypothetical protein, partial [Mesorhizobium sp.]|uniref:hypothetical protein n=1 Tax=Mesorhizobium sp. TaxID=1871066 RepID=UPI0025C22A71
LCGEGDHLGGLYGKRLHLGVLDGLDGHVFAKLRGVSGDNGASAVALGAVPATNGALAPFALWRRRRAAPSRLSRSLDLQAVEIG